MTIKTVFLSLATFAVLSFFQKNAQAQATQLPENQAVYTKEQLYDHLLGLLVGSAIGDAMGAPVEMWGRSGIQADYGYISAPDPHVREASAEGPWKYNLPAGGTTDDTRWKALAVNFFTQKKNNGQFLLGKKPEATAFAQYIVDQYEKDIQSLKATVGFDPEPYEEAARRMQWLQEWALAARPYAAKDYEAYADAVSRFYGGEMVCAGLLYAPAIGGFYPGNPAEAYDEAWRLSIFDLGYARDITALTAALTAAALNPARTPESLWASLREIDPQGFSKSRLVGRTSFRLFRQAQDIVYQCRQLQPGQGSGYIPPNFRGDTLQFFQMQKAFELLDSYNQDMPFHAGEIYLINLTALLFSDLDFQTAMEFVVNFGRDNDTVGAVTGGILGAYHGFSKLPACKSEVLKVNRELLGIDLEALARAMTEAAWNRP